MPIDLVPQLIGASLRALGLGTAAFVGLLLFRVRSSAARHAVWTAVLAGMLLQMPLGMIAPTLQLKTPPILSAPVQLLVRDSAGSLSRGAPVPASHTRLEANGRRLPLRTTLTGIYLAVSMLLFARMAIGSWGLRRILRDAHPIPELGFGVFQSIAFVTPGSAGCFRPKVLLPLAWRNWDASQLRAVLAHEQAHLRRQDWLIRAASHVNVCIFWFHPLAWWMECELAHLAEESCDDVALSKMDDPQEYAATLVDIARAAAASGGVLNWHIISMAKESNVMRRVDRILNRRLPVSKQFGRFAWVALFAISLPVIYLSAAVDLARSAQAAAAPPTRAPRVNPATTMCILIDNSGSMRDRRAEAKAAALALVQASQPGDEVCIIDFNDEAFNDLPHGKDFTSDIGEMEEALKHIDSRGGKAMRDAIRMSIDQVEQPAHHDRRVLLLITEGNDTASTVSQDVLLNKVKNSGVRIYCIGLLSGVDSQRAGTARLALGQIAEASGGLTYYPKDLAEVRSISRQIADEVRRQ